MTGTVLWLALLREIEEREERADRSYSKKLLLFMTLFSSPSLPLFSSLSVVWMGDRVSE